MSNRIIGPLPFGFKRFPARLKRSPEERLRNAVLVDSNGCWIFQNSRNEQGYGHFYVNGRQTSAHRAAHEIFIGPVPEGHLVLHKCDVPSCCNPDHLFTGTQKDNMQDAISKGRFRYHLNNRKGTSHPQSSLTPEQVELIGQSKLSAREIARIFDVNPKTVNRYRNRLKNGVAYG